MAILRQAAIVHPKPYSSPNNASNAATSSPLTGTPSTTVSGATPRRRTNSSTAAGSWVMSLSVKGIPQSESNAFTPSQGFHPGRVYRTTVRAITLAPHRSTFERL
jgi:hypothetical protein